MKKIISLILFAIVLFLGMDYVMAKTITPQELVNSVKNNKEYQFIYEHCGDDLKIEYNETTKKIISQCTLENGYTSIITGTYDEDEQSLTFAHTASYTDDNILYDMLYEEIFIVELNAQYGYSTEYIDAVFSKENENKYDFSKFGVQYDYVEHISADSSKVSAPLNVKISLDGGFGPAVRKITPQEYVAGIKASSAYSLVNSSCIGGWQVEYDESQSKIITVCEMEDSSQTVRIDGIYDASKKSVSFVHLTNTNDEIALEGILVRALGEIYGYSDSYMQDIFDEEGSKTYTFEKDGVEFDYVKYTNATTAYGVKNFKVSLDGGFGPYKTTSVVTSGSETSTTDDKPKNGGNSISDEDKNSEDEKKSVDNPKTTDINPTYIILGILSSGALIFIVKRKIKTIH